MTTREVQEKLLTDIPRKQREAYLQKVRNLDELVKRRTVLTVRGKHPKTVGDKTAKHAPPVGAVVGLELTDGSFFLGGSICSDDDMPYKKVGRECAEVRARHVAAATQVGVPLLPCWGRPAKVEELEGLKEAIFKPKGDVRLAVCEALGATPPRWLRMKTEN